MFDLKNYLADGARWIEAALDRLVPPASARPASLHAAMRHSLFAGGKRLRPLLCAASAEACGAPRDAALFPAAAIECLHTYTLIHDDLPCMDDDDFRRGKPSCHKAHGEPVALLAGDALLTEAFGVVAQCRAVAPELRCRVIRDLSRAVGSTGVIGGQVEDILCTGRGDVDMDTVTYIHRNKTAEFLACCCRLGAMVAGADGALIGKLDGYGMNLGLAFQITDDVLDIVGDREKMGKSIGKDEKSNKATYPAFLGLEGARVRAREHMGVALRCLDAVEAGRRGVLEGLAEMVVSRDS